MEESASISLSDFLTTSLLRWWDIGRIEVEGIFQGIDVANENVLVSQLTTPMGTIEETRLRVTDIQTIFFDVSSRPGEAGP